LQGPGLVFCLLGCARLPEAMQLQNEPTCPVPLSETHRFANTRSSLRRSAGNARSVEGACQTSESIDGDGKQCPRSIGCGTAGASPRLMDSQADS
jgi:hypothetical protein